jgi:hypothetical protein
MRDKERICRMLGKIELLWNAMPDQRFGQMMENLIRYNHLFNFKYNEYLLIPYLWGQEDNETEEKLDKIIKELGL